jgi:hypothetical protein
MPLILISDAQTGKHVLPGGRVAEFEKEFSVLSFYIWGEAYCGSTILRMEKVHVSDFWWRVYLRFVKIADLLGAVAHACNSNYLGDGNRRIAV